MFFKKWSDFAIVCQKNSIFKNDQFSIVDNDWVLLGFVAHRVKQNLVVLKTIEFWGHTSAL